MCKDIQSFLFTSNFKYTLCFLFKELSFLEVLNTKYEFALIITGIWHIFKNFHRLVIVLVTRPLWALKKAKFRDLKCFTNYTSFTLNRKSILLYGIILIFAAEASSVSNRSWKNMFYTMRFCTRKQLVFLTCINIGFLKITVFQFIVMQMLNTVTLVLQSVFIHKCMI